MISRPELAAFYERRNAEKYVTSDNPENRLLVGRMARWLELRSDDAVLDIGCSDGYFLDRLRARCGIHDAWGVDVSQVAVEAAHRLVDASSGLRFTVADAEALPFGAQQFDKIIVNEVIEHVAEPDLMLAEIARVTKPGACVFLTAPNAYEEMLPVFRPYCRKVDRVEGHLRRFSQRALRDLVARHGFDLIKVRYEGFFGSLLWYGIVIYNAPLKKFAMRLITRSAPRIGTENIERPRFNALSAIPFAAMYLTKALDYPFGSYRRAMGMHALLRKRRSAPS